MTMWQRVLTTGVVLLAATVAVAADEAKPEASNPYAQWKNGPPKDASFFPIAVWCQDPANAARSQAGGHQRLHGPVGRATEADLVYAQEDRDAAHLRPECRGPGSQERSDHYRLGCTATNRTMPRRSRGGKGYGPPILPAKIIAGYDAVRKADPTRPVLLNLGRSVAWDGFPDRGVRSGHDEDYAEYAKGCDIVSFDVYPMFNVEKPAVKGQLDLVAHGVENLIKWTGGHKIVWNVIECTAINGTGKATPKQVKAEVWTSLVSGSQGITYFVHEFKPKFDEHALLDDPPMLTAVTALNKQIHELAPALNSPTVKDALKVEG